jgi:HlyD family secretion protein
MPSTADTPIAETQPGLPLPLVRRDPPCPAAPSAGRRTESRWRRGASILLAVGLVGAAATAWLGRTPRPDAPAAVPLVLPAGPVAAPAVPGTVVGLGRLVPRGRIVVLAPPFGAGDARIAELRAVRRRML